MGEKKHNKLSNYKIILGGTMKIDPPIILFLFLIQIPLIGQFNHENQKKELKWEMGTQVLEEWKLPGFSGIYVSRKINQKLDLFGISSGMAGIIRGESNKANSLNNNSISKINIDKFNCFLALKLNKSYENNSSLYVMLGPSYRRYYYDYAKAVNTNFQDIGKDLEYESQIKSLFGGNVLINDIFSISLDIPFIWYRMLTQNDGSIVRFGPKIQGVFYNANIRIGLKF